jgi:hypothetical protein
MDSVMQREREHCRLTAEGRRTEDGDRCTLLVVHERGGVWAFYPHGWGKFGVRLPAEQARRVAQAILDGGQ